MAESSDKTVNTVVLLNIIARRVHVLLDIKWLSETIETAT